MGEVIRVGIAGLGRSGWGIHARLLEPLGEMYQVAAVADLILHLLIVDRMSSAMIYQGQEPIQGITRTV